MEVSSRKKRPQPTAATGMGTHANSHVSEYGSQVAAMQAANGGAMGLSSGTRRSYGGTAAQKMSPLSMYNDPPQEEITLDQFERAGVDRLQGQFRSEAANRAVLQRGLANSEARARL